jgi:hypothetical protein
MLNSLPTDKTLMDYGIVKVSFIRNPDTHTPTPVDTLEPGKYFIYGDELARWNDAHKGTVAHGHSSSLNLERIFPRTWDIPRIFVPVPDIPRVSSSWPRCNSTATSFCAILQMWTLRGKVDDLA